MCQLRILPPWNEKSSWTQDQDRAHRNSVWAGPVCRADSAMLESVWYYRNRRSIREMPKAVPLCASPRLISCNAGPGLSGGCLFLKHMARSAPPTLGGLRMMFAIFFWVRVQTSMSQLSYCTLDQRHLQYTFPKELLRRVFYWFIR